MLGGPRKEAGAGAAGAGSARTVRRAALALALAGALASPASASAAPARAAAKLRAASAPVSELKPVAAIALPGGATAYRFQQRVSGVTVLNGQVVVSDPRGAPPELVADSSKPRIEPARRRRALARRFAAEVALRSAGVSGLRGPWSASLAVQPGEGGTLVWRVVMSSARPAAATARFSSTPSRARVVRTRDLLQRSRRGHAQLYNPNPVAQNRRLIGAAQATTATGTRRVLTSLRRPVTLRTSGRGSAACAASGCTPSSAAARRRSASGASGGWA